MVFKIKLYILLVFFVSCLLNSTSFCADQVVGFWTGNEKVVF